MKLYFRDVTGSAELVESLADNHCTLDFLVKCFGKAMLPVPTAPSITRGIHWRDSFGVDNQVT